jgi:endonuclease/exonuclease/phosphatase family metal-dependent hydrolase
MAMLRIGTFNLLHGMTLTDGATDPGRLRAAAIEVDADLMALQEVDNHLARSADQDQAGHFAAAMGARWFRFVPTVSGTPGRPGCRPARDGADDAGPSYGIALVSRLPVREWRVCRFTAAPARLPMLVPSGHGPRLALVPDEPRAALAAVVEGGHGPFAVVGTHLSFVPGFNLRQLRSIVRWAADLPRPVFIAGDLNLPGRLPARSTGWTPLVSARSYPARAPRVQLDHVLAHGLPAGRVHSGHVWDLPVSDHCAIGVDVEV